MAAPSRPWLQQIVSATLRRWRSRWISQRARLAKRIGGAEAAGRVLRIGIETLPQDAQLWNDLAAVQIELLDVAGAEHSIRRAMDLDPQLAQAHCNLGIVLAERGDEQGALRYFEQAIRLDPSLDAVRVNRALLLSKMQMVELALDAWNGVLLRTPKNGRAHAEKAALLFRMGRFSEARVSLERARILGASEADVSLYESLIEAEAGDPEVAVRGIETLRGRFEDAEIDWNLAHVRLSSGDFERGWPLYEARLRKSSDSPRRAYRFGEWQGEPVRPGELLVMAEQGLGDEIMFASCYPDLIRRAPGCVIECDPRLETLIRRSFPGASIAGVPRGNDRTWLAAHPQLRLQVHAGSLPRFFRDRRERFPRHDGYLRPDPERVQAWRNRLEALGGKAKVGIAWNGGLAHTRRALRCVPPEQFAPLLRDPTLTFVSLQYDDQGAVAARLHELSGARISVFEESFASLDENAALTRALDVVVTVCSSVAHMSGAVGVPTWVLTPKAAEWRYQRGGDSMPWYPAVRLFRQDQGESWDEVVARVAEALADVSRKGIGTQKGETS